MNTKFYAFITSLDNSPERNGRANVRFFKDYVFDYPPEVRRLVNEVFDKIGLTDGEEAYIDFKRVYADERAIPENGWAIFAESAEGLYAVFHDAIPMMGLYVTMRGEEYKAGAFIREDIGGTSLYATNTVEDATDNKWTEEGACGKVLPAIAMDFLYGFSCKSSS